MQLNAIKAIFDHGTIIIEGLSKQSPVALANVLKWDERISAWRGLAYHYEQIRSVLKNAEIIIDDQCGLQLNHGNSTIKSAQKVALRHYQQNAYESWILHHKKGIVSLPTGSGKTLIAMKAIEETKGRVLVLVPTRILMHQWKTEAQKFFSGEIGCCGDGVKDIREITIATYAWSLQHMARYGGMFNLLIVDEVHHFGCNEYDEILKMSMATMRLGLSATPWEKDEQKKILVDLIGPNVFSLGISALVGEHLSPFMLRAIGTNFSNEEKSTYQQADAHFHDFAHEYFGKDPNAKWHNLVYLAQKSSSGYNALQSFRRKESLLNWNSGKQEKLRELLNNHWRDKVLVFTKDTYTAFQIAQIFLIPAITGEISKNEREEILNNFRGGRVRALVSCRVLNEGMDIPDAGVGIIVGGSWARREFVQRLGRLLRPVPGKVAVVYQLYVQNTSEYRKVYRQQKSL